MKKFVKMNILRDESPPPYKRPLSLFVIANYKELKKSMVFGKK